MTVGYIPPEQVFICFVILGIVTILMLLFNWMCDKWLVQHS